MDKYCIKLNKSGQVLTYYRYAISPEQALWFGVLALEQEMGLNKGALKKEFSSKKNNREVEKCQ